jgi:hypothetical protein
MTCFHIKEGEAAFLARCLFRPNSPEHRNSVACESEMQLNREPRVQSRTRGWNREIRQGNLQGRFKLQRFRILGRWLLIAQPRVVRSAGKEIVLGIVG